jgi:predicted unusual protein kinase regulating ubiquinone biosynthesis (AarF/ABC1/UbiB family)
MMHQSACLAVSSPPAMADEAFRRIDALIQVGMRLARSAPSGRVLLARIAQAIEPEWIPRPWGDTITAELEAAHRDACRPIPFKDVERALRSAWGGKPSDELDSLESEPAAVTPAAQVHRAMLDGKPVAVKVQRPGLAASVRQDIVLVESLLAPLGAAFPAVDAAAVMREFRERILDELDLETEAASQRRFHRALRGHPFLSVPAPVTALARANVLVSEWVHGTPLRDAPDPDLAAARLVVFVIGAARAGFAHADPDPDDVLVGDDGRLTILDFGATRPVDRARFDASVDALEAFVADDAQAFGAATEQLGALGAEHARTAIDLVRESLGELAGADPVRLDTPAVIAARDRLFDHPRALVELITAGSLPPEDMWPARGVAQLFGTIARVGAVGPWRELARAAAREGWDADPAP